MSACQGSKEPDKSPKGDKVRMKCEEERGGNDEKRKGYQTESAIKGLVLCKWEINLGTQFE